MTLEPRGPRFRPDEPVVTPEHVEVPEPGKVTVQRPFWIRWWADRQRIADRAREGAAKVMDWNDRISRAWDVLRGKEKR